MPRPVALLLASLCATHAVDVNATAADNALDLCAATAAPVEDGSNQLLLVALGAKSNLYARLVDTDGTSSAWLAAPPPANGIRGGPSLVTLPRGEGLLCVICDGEGVLRSSVLSASAEWGTWVPLGMGSECAHGPALVNDARGGVHAIAVRASDRVLTHGFASSSLGSWTFSSLETPAATPPTAAIDAAGALQLVVRGVDGTVFHREATRNSAASSMLRLGGAHNGWTWTMWRALDGRVAGSPRLLERRTPSALLTVVGRGMLDSTAHRIAQAPVAAGQRKVWQRRQPLGGLLASAPTAAEDATGEVHVLGLGPDGTTWHRAAAAAHGWGSLGGEAVTVPLVSIRPADGLLSVIVGGVDGQLHMKPMRSYPNGTVGWGAWAALGGPVRPWAC